MLRFFKNIVAVPVLFFFWLFGTPLNISWHGKHCGKLKWFKYTKE